MKNLGEDFKKGWKNMKQSWNFSLRGQVILEELLYTIAMLSLIFLVYYLKGFVERKVNGYVCVLSLNKFLRDFYLSKDFLKNFNYVEISSRESPYIFSDEERVCCKYRGEICCIYIREQIYGILAGEIKYYNGIYKLS